MVGLGSHIYELYQGIWKILCHAHLRRNLASFKFWVYYLSAVWCQIHYLNSLNHSIMHEIIILIEKKVRSCKMLRVPSIQSECSVIVSITLKTELLSKNINYIINLELPFSILWNMANKLSENWKRRKLLLTFKDIKRGVEGKMNVIIENSMVETKVPSN